MRPYLLTFLHQVSKLFTIIVFTLAEKDYADRVIEKIDPHRKYLVRRLYREHCV